MVVTAIKVTPLNINRLNYIEANGLEVEVFCLSDNNIVYKGEGEIKKEAGRRMWELITPPVSSTEKAFEILKSMETHGVDNFKFMPFSSDSREGDELWNADPRYDALRAALTLERSQFCYLLDAIAKSAAVHINFSGPQITANKELMVFLVNVFNVITPYLGAKIHKDIGMGAGHLAIWQKFACAERFPQAERWFACWEELVRYVESTRRLYKYDGDNDKPIIYPDENLSIDNDLDLTFLWWFLRYKLGPWGPYLELRLLPSMPLGLLKSHVDQILGLIQTIIAWFLVVNKGRSVVHKDKGDDVLNYVLENTNFNVPEKMLNGVDWLDLFNNH